MTKQEQEKIAQMLKSTNIDDINLAGVLISDWLKIDKEKLQLLYKFVEILSDQVSNKLPYTTKFELLRQLLLSDVHNPDLTNTQSTWTGNMPSAFFLPYYTGDTTITTTGLTTYETK